MIIKDNIKNNINLGKSVEEFTWYSHRVQAYISDSVWSLIWNYYDNFIRNSIRINIRSSVRENINKNSLTKE